MKKPFRLDMIPLQGSARQRGRIYGESVREKIHAMLEEVKEAILHKTGDEGEELLKSFIRSTGYLARAEAETPELVEEVRGLAEGANLSFDAAFALQSVEGLSIHAHHGETNCALGACSALAVWAQPGYPTLLAQNADNSAAWHDKLTLLHVRYPDSDTEVYTLTFSGLLGVYGMNSHGLGVCINSLGLLRKSDDGLSVPLVSRRLLECRTVPEAEAFLRGTRHLAGENFVIGGHDRAVSYECSANQVAAYRPQDEPGRLFHTNHILVNRDQIDTTTLPESTQARIPIHQANSQTRMTTLQTFLKDKHPVTVADIQAALSTHGESPVCNHLDDANPANVTNYGMVMELSAHPVLHVSSGPPCSNAFWRFTF